MFTNSIRIALIFEKMWPLLLGISYSSVIEVSNGRSIALAYLLSLGNLINCFPVVFIFWQICDPPASVYKGYAMPKDTEKYLMSCGLKNALYSIRASDITEELFGNLAPCPFQVI